MGDLCRYMVLFLTASMSLIGTTWDVLKTFFNFNRKSLDKYNNNLKYIFRAAQQAAAALAAHTGTGTRRGPPPLLRSRTLPAIIVPGISILNAQLDPSRLTPGNYRNKLKYISWTHYIATVFLKISIKLRPFHDFCHIFMATCVSGLDKLLYLLVAVFNGCVVLYLLVCTTLIYDKLIAMHLDALRNNGPNCTWTNSGKCLVCYYYRVNVERRHLQKIPESYGMTIAIAIWG